MQLMTGLRLLLLAGTLAAAAASMRKTLVSLLPADLRHKTLSSILPVEARRVVSDLWHRQRETSCRSARMPLRILLVRHGQSEANTRAALVVGGRDVATPLSAKGELQARLLGERLRQEALQPDRVIASHAVRARRTAEIACGVLGFDAHRIETEPRVVEFSQGALEKRPRAEIYRPDGPVMRGIRAKGMFYRPPGFSPDGDRGESQYDVELRVREFIEELLLTPEDGGVPGEQTVVVFSHGIAIRSFLRGVLSADTKFVVRSQTENTSITELVYSPKEGDMGGWVLVRFNDAAHLTAGWTAGA